MIRDLVMPLSGSLRCGNVNAMSFCLVKIYHPIADKIAYSGSDEFIRYPVLILVNAGDERKCGGYVCQDF